MSFVEKLKTNPVVYKIGVYLKIIYYDFIIDTIDLMKIQMRKMNILKEHKFELIKSYKDKFKGKRCFIIATGPSLTMEDLALLKDEYTIGVNSLVKVLDQMEYIPTFLGIQDSLVYAKIGKLIDESKLKKIFITDKLYNSLDNKNSDRYIQYSLYYKRHGEHNNLRPLTSGFSSDVSLCVYDGYSITYSMLQIAVYMGFTEIYLLGCDCNYDTKGGKQHFVESGHIDKNAATGGERMIYAYTVADKELKERFPHVKVYNATRGGMLEVFPRKTLDEIFKSSNI